MRVLAIDTSTDTSVVSLVDRGVVLASDAQQTEQRHAETLLPRIEAQLRAASLGLRDLDLIAAGIGPGSFTGLRVGLSTAKGLALAAGIPLRGVPSLHALARGALCHADRALVAIDAGRGELFGAAFALDHAGRPRALLSPRLATPDTFAQACRGVALAGAVACGAGVRRYLGILEPALPADVRLLPPDSDAPHPQHVAAEACADFAAEGSSNVAQLEPLYMRASDAKLPDRPLAI